jgi:hypothetical protein
VGQNLAYHLYEYYEISYTTDFDGKASASAAVCTEKCYR